MKFQFKNYFLKIIFFQIYSWVLFLFLILFKLLLVNIERKIVDVKMTERIEKKGYMFKRGEINKNSFKKRWMVLKNGILYYYDVNDKSDENKLKGSIDLSELKECSFDKFGKELKINNNNYYLLEISLINSSRKYQLYVNKIKEGVDWQVSIQKASKEKPTGESEIVEEKHEEIKVNSAPNSPNPTLSKRTESMFSKSIMNIVGKKERKVSMVVKRSTWASPLPQ
jgi:hypothetical protein